MLAINEQIQIPESEFSWSFVRSGGPGGQNVNKVASKAVLRWPVVVTPSLPADVKQRLCVQQQNRITVEGELVVSSQLTRDQDRNREDCLEKVRTMVLRALSVPRPRKKTRPGKGAKERRLGAKRHRAAAKASRRSPGGE